MKLFVNREFGNPTLCPKLDAHHHYHELQGWLNGEYLNKFLACSQSVKKSWLAMAVFEILEP